MKDELDSKVIPYLLVGSWKSGYEADLEILVKLGAKEKDPELLSHLNVGEESSYFNLASTTWTISNREEKFLKSFHIITPRKLRNYEEACLNVIAETDPSLELDPRERYLATVQGKIRKFSSTLRTGLAEGLIILVSITEYKYSGFQGLNTTPREFVNGIISQMLSELKWSNWASIGENLPIIAEASPGVFMNKLQESLEYGEMGAIQLFSQSGGSYGSNPHVDLLWALERIAWLPDHFIDAVLLLAELAHSAPEVKISNNPTGSLMSIFRPVLSQTIASEEQKWDVLELLVERYPEVARNLLFSMIPSGRNTILDSNNRPKSLSDYEHPDKDNIDLEKLWNAVNNAVEMLLSETYGCEELADLIKEIPNLQHPKGREAIFNSLRNLSPAEDENSDSCCWMALHKVLHWQEIRKKVAEDIPEELLEELHKHYERLSPEDLVIRYSWLFSSYPRPPFDIGEADPEKDEKIIALREYAISDILSNPEWQTVLLELIDQIKTPYKIGELLSETALEEEIVKQIKRIPLDGNTHREQFFYSFMRSRLKHDNPKEFLEEAESQYAENGDSIRFAITLSTLEPIIQLWDKIASYADDIECEYWNRFRSFSLDSNEPEFVYALKKLIEFHKYPSAIMLLSHSLHYHKPVGELPAELTEIVDAILVKLDEEDVLKEIAANTYEIQELLENLFKYGFDSERLFLLEKKLFYFLEHSGYSYPGLSNHMMENPDEFVEIVKWVYRSEEDEEGRELDDKDRDHAEFGFRFLHRWNGIPGFINGELETTYLRDWINTVLAKCSKIGRGKIVLYEIARILNRIPTGSDEITLHEAASTFIEEIASTTLDEAIMTEIMNSRGVVTKALGEGGKQERELSARFSKEADSLDSKYIRTKQILKRLADHYLQDANREDIRAEKYKE